MARDVDGVRRVDVGLLLAVAAAGVMSNLVFGVAPRDAASLIVATSVLMLVTVVASYIAAPRRGGRSGDESAGGVTRACHPGASEASRRTCSWFTLFARGNRRGAKQVLRLLRSHQDDTRG